MRDMATECQLPDFNPLSSAWCDISQKGLRGIPYTFLSCSRESFFFVPRNTGTGRVLIPHSSSLPGLVHTTLPLGMAPCHVSQVPERSFCLCFGEAVARLNLAQGDTCTWGDGCDARQYCPGLGLLTCRLTPWPVLDLSSCTFSMAWSGPMLTGGPHRALTSPTNYLLGNWSKCLGSINEANPYFFLLKTRRPQTQLFLLFCCTMQLDLHLKQSTNWKMFSSLKLAV